MIKFNNFRVISVYRDKYIISNLNIEYLVELSGKYLFESLEMDNRPVVGDYVRVNDNKKIIEVIERKNFISRKKAGKKFQEQIIASNIDIGFVVTSLNKEFNINKIERFVNIVKLNEIKPVIILTKSDLCDNYDYYISVLRDIFNDIDIVITSSFNNQGIESLRNYFLEDVTGIFLGSSGVGKSTLINLLIEGANQHTSEVRICDDKGRHTTTSRDLFYFDNGACIIDTPGLREIGYWFNQELQGEYEDIEIFAKNCRFKDCKHRDEPGCAVKDAVRKGYITLLRYNSYIKYKKEIEKFYYHNSNLKYEYKNRLKKKSKQERFSKKK